VNRLGEILVCGETSMGRTVRGAKSHDIDRQFDRHETCTT